MNKEQFENAYKTLESIYTNTFYETLKDRALGLGLSDAQRRELCEDQMIWTGFTNYFTNLREELGRRNKNGYYDTSDLLNPPTKDLEFQVTEQVIKLAYIKQLIQDSYDFTSRVNYLANMDLYDFIEKFKTNKLGDYLEERFPIENIKSEIPFEYKEELLDKVYHEFFRQPPYPNLSLETSIALSNYATMCIVNFNSIYEENPDDKNAIFENIKYISDFFYENTTEVLTNGFQEGDDSEKFESRLVDILLKYKDEIIEDKELSHFYSGYLIEKIKLLKGFHYDLIDLGGRLEVIGGGFRYRDGGFKIGEPCGEGIYKSYSNHHEEKERFYQLYITKEKLGELISWFKDTEEYDILEIYYMLYGDILKRDEAEQFIKELSFRLKRISEKDDNINVGLREYLMYLLFNVFIDENGGNKPAYFDSISEDIKDIFGEDEYKKFELLFSDKSLSKGDKDTRKNYKIGLVFGDRRSKRAFDYYCNDEKNEKDFTDRQLDKKQFDILTEYFSEQQDLDIENKLKNGSLTFVLTFETDHETKLRKLMKIYPDRIIVCNVPKQHFSHEQFRKMLDLGLRNVEGK